MSKTYEPPEMSDIVRLWIDLTIGRVLDGNRVDLEFTMFPFRSDPSKVIVVDAGGLRTKDQASFAFKLAIAKENPNEYLFASESYMFVPSSDMEGRYLQSVQRGDLSLKDVPGTTDIIMFLYGSETAEYLHVVHLKTLGEKTVVTKREWILSDDETKKAGRFVGFRELQQSGHKGREN